MKLAEALNLRADLNKRIAQLQSRLTTNAKTQEGEAPAEAPEALLAELKSCITQLEDLICRINETNCRTQDGDATLTALLAKRDALTLHNAVLRAFLSAASEKADRYSLKEIRVVSTVNVAALQKDVDAAARELRTLDTRIQQLNWNTELL